MKSFKQWMFSWELNSKSLAKCKAIKLKYFKYKQDVYALALLKGGDSADVKEIKNYIRQVVSAPVNTKLSRLIKEWRENCLVIRLYKRGQNNYQESRGFTNKVEAMVYFVNREKQLINKGYKEIK